MLIQQKCGSNLLATVLVEHLKLLSKGRVCLACDSMHVHDGLNIWTGSVDAGMYVEPSRVDNVHVAPNHVAFIIDQNKVFGSHMVEASAKWIDPEVIRKLGVADSHMATRALISVTLRSKPSQSSSVV